MPPSDIVQALASGITTLLGGGTGPADGTKATTCTPSKFYMHAMIAATDSIPLNFGFTGKGNDSGERGLRDIVKAGACGLKLHEDWGSTPEAIDRALTVGDEYDVQVSVRPSSATAECADGPVCRSIYIPIPLMRVDMSRLP